MYLSEIQIQNFKSFEDVTIRFHEKLNVLTGVNNSGKTTILEAITLWLDCYNLLIREAGKGRKGRFNQGDFIFGGDVGIGKTNAKTIKGIYGFRTTYHEDIFYKKNTGEPIILNATFRNEFQSIDLKFEIKNIEGERYEISFPDHTTFDYKNFQTFFNRRYMPNPIGSTYASPLAVISSSEPFFTSPQIREALKQREGFKVFRNRLFQLYSNFNRPQIFNEFKESLNLILGDNGKNAIALELSSDSNIQKDVNVIFNFLEKSSNFRGELSLLGSGTIQIIEILLHVFGTEADKDLNLVLLDEPDSHIHRSIQQRLVEVLGNYGANPIQIFLTTHNEALIHSVNPECLFHIEGKNKAEYTPIGSRLVKTGVAHFKGLFPSGTKNLISELRGEPNGLDMITVLEADRVILVEGEDDALAFDLLIQKYERAKFIPKMKYAFWVLGGVGEVYSRIEHYKTVLSAIKNDKTVWEKAFLVIDRDHLPDEYLPKLQNSWLNNHKISSHIFNSYTFESTLLMNLPLFAELLVIWAKSVSQNVALDKEVIKNKLNEGYQKFGQKINKEKLSSEPTLQDHFTKLVNAGAIKHDTDNRGISFTKKFEEYIKTTLQSGEYYKLMNKDNVQECINEVLQPFGLEFSSKDDFLALIEGSTALQIKQFPEWDTFLTKIKM